MKQNHLIRTNLDDIVPELIESLRECLGLLDIIREMHDNPFGIHHNNAMDIESKARAAIAKAEGMAE